MVVTPLTRLRHSFRLLARDTNLKIEVALYLALIFFWARSIRPGLVCFGNDNQISAYYTTYSDCVA